MNKYFKFSIVLLLTLFIVNTVNIYAQRRPVRRTGKKSTNAASTTRSARTGRGTNRGRRGSRNLQNAVDTTTGPIVSTQKKDSIIIPYVWDTTGGGSGVNEVIKVSLRPDNIVQKNLVKDRTPLVYEHIREDDAVFKQRIWREIDSREKINLAFRYSLVENNGSQRFISILINAIKSGVQCFDPGGGTDDRFTNPLSSQQALSSFGSVIDTTPVYNDDGTVKQYTIRPRSVDLDSVYKFAIKEEVVFDKQTSRMFTRILGIAPMMPQITSTGVSLGMRTLFWLYYPDLRPTLAKYEVYNPKNFGARMSWEDLFESRMFSSYITKSTYDNPFDKTLKDKYGKNGLFILLEGEAIKSKIFNYEQDLWSY